MPRKKKHKQDLNGSKLKAGQKRLTPGQFKEPEYKAPKAVDFHRHPDLQPTTITGLSDALRLNGVAFSSSLDGQYECLCKTAVLTREINPHSPSEIIEFFRDVLCRL